MCRVCCTQLDDFTANVIKEVQESWPSLAIIHGRPRHLQSQGCVERANSDFWIKLGKWMDSTGSQWSKGHAMNMSISETTGKSPYELVFGQPARQHQTLLDKLSNCSCS